MNKQTATILGACIALGLIGASLVLGSIAHTVRMANRVVSVRGLAEREVVSDLVVWTLRYQATGDVLAEAYAALEAQQQKVQSFLTEQGVATEDLRPLAVKVTDKQANEYNGNFKSRYTLEGGIEVRATDVKKIAALSNMTQALVKAGVTLADSNCGNPAFKFTKLNEVKPDMLAEATKNARLAADQFAKDSGAKVGEIRTASQGYFSISGRDSVSSGGEGQETCEAESSLIKKLRVVTTLEYYLK